jgi:hypothetical protein
MLVVGLVPAQAEDVRLNDASASYELEVNSSAQVFALVGPRDLQARSLTVASGQESVGMFRGPRSRPCVPLLIVRRREPATSRSIIGIQVHPANTRVPDTPPSATTV